MKIIIINNQDSLRIINKKIEKQIKLILKEENIITDEIILHFVNEKTIKKFHLKYFNDPLVTDCISFPIDPPKENKTGYHVLGEGFICTPQAKKYSKKYKKDPYEELTLYIIHCILHLIGYDDINKKDAMIMRKKENYYLSSFKKKKLI